MNPEAAVGGFNRTSALEQRYLSIHCYTANSRGFGVWVLANGQTFFGSDFAAKGLSLGYLKGGAILKGNIFSILTGSGCWWGRNTDRSRLHTSGYDRDRAQQCSGFVPAIQIFHPFNSSSNQNHYLYCRSI
ncbi:MULTISPECIES: hypothetical protein [unclassified Microcoleus]|uniref:hypothetical protein n=1 Tax=unclassified Microcoleus TaxID=2642155 RepID=UPI002FD5A14C